MDKELLELYKNDAAFKEYCDKWCANHDLSISEVFDFNILREYAEWLKQAGSHTKQN